MEMPVGTVCTGVAVRSVVGNRIADDVVIVVGLEGRVRVDCDARQRVTSEHVVDHNVPVVLSSRGPGEESDAGAFAADQAVAFRGVAFHNDVIDAERRVDGPR